MGRKISRGHAELAGAAIYIEGARAEGHGLAEAVEVDKGNEILKEFAEVQRLTSCSTGCGGCHDKIMAVLSERLSG